MDRKEAKKHYMIMRLNDPSVSEWEKKHIRQRLGIRTLVSKQEFIEKEKNELLNFVDSYLHDQISAIRRKKQVKDPFQFLSNNIKTIYHLSGYSASFDDDSLEQIYEVDEGEDMKQLSIAFKEINLFNESALIDSVLRKPKISNKEIKLLQDHFWDSDIAVQKIEKAIHDFILVNIEELIDLQSI